MGTPHRGDGLDVKDLRMIEILQQQGRISLAALGRQVGLSQPATSERLARLEERGVIQGYGARINLAALGLSTLAVIRLRTSHEHIRACLKLFARMPQIIEVLRLTGEDCFFLKTLVPAPTDLERIVDAIGRYGTVTTSIVLRAEEPKYIGRDLLGQR